MVVDVANALAITSADRTNPMVRIRPGVVHRNHQRGCAGVVGDRDASGSVDGCANSTVTCARTSSFRLLPRLPKLYKRILRAVGMTCGQSSAPPCAGVPYPERVRGDGDGWVMSDNGAAFWGRHGAAGLLLRAPRPDGSAAVLLQHRAPWSHQGGTWGLPGGARDSHETAEQAAVREAHEEAGLPADQLTVRTTRRHRHREPAATGPTPPSSPTRRSCWRRCPIGRAPNCGGSPRTRWPTLPLHPGFAASWERLRAVTASIPLLVNRR